MSDDQPTLLIGDLTSKKLRQELGKAGFNFPPHTNKSTISFGLRFSKQVGSRHQYYYPTVQGLRALVGEVDLRPVSGSFTVKVDGEETASISYDAVAPDYQTALNDLPSLSGVTVEEDDGTFVVKGIPHATPITVEDNSLRPMSFVRVHAYTVDAVEIQTIRLMRTPLAYTDDYRQEVPPAPSIEAVTDGSTADGVIINEVQQLNVPVEFNGQYRIKTADNIQKSDILGVADGPEEIATAINPKSNGSHGLASDDDGVLLVTEHRTEPAVLIEFAGSMEGTDVDLLTVDVISAPPGDYYMDLRLDTVAMTQALRSVDQIKAPLEIYVDVDVDGETEPWLVYRGSLTIQEAVDHEDMSTPLAIEFNEPPARKQYPAQDPSTVTSGTRFHEFVIADAATTPQAVAHNLASPRTQVFLRENIAGGNHLVPGTDFSVVYDSDNQLTVTLLGSYNPAPEELLGTVQDLTLTSTWQAHTQAISTITGLQAILDAYGSAIAALQSESGISVPGVSAEPSYRVEWDIPAIFEVFPLLGAPDLVLPENGKIAGFDQDQLPSFVPALFPAIHQTSATALPVTNGRLATPVAGEKGQLFQNVGMPISMPLSSRLVTEGNAFGFGYQLPTGGYATHNGQTWYPLVQYGAGGESSYYPRTLERTLWQDTVSGKQLRSGRAWEARFSVEVAALQANTQWHWYLVIETAQLPAATTPGTPGGNLSEDDWEEKPRYEQRMVIPIGTPRKYRFGYRVTRSSAGALSAQALEYGVWISATAPDSEEFAVRARLVRADTVDRIENPRGFLVVAGFSDDDDPESGKIKVTD